jgi:hypothetical protein
LIAVSRRRSRRRVGCNCAHQAIRFAIWKGRVIRRRTRRSPHYGVAFDCSPRVPFPSARGEETRPWLRDHVSHRRCTRCAADGHRATADACEGRSALAFCGAAGNADRCATRAGRVRCAADTRRAADAGREGVGAGSGAIVTAVGGATDSARERDETDGG